MREILNAKNCRLEYQHTEKHGKGEYSVAEKGISGFAQRTRRTLRVSYQGRAVTP